MNEIILATRNDGKIVEIKRALDLPFIKWMTYKDFKEWPHIEETDITFKDNAIYKASMLARCFYRAALADDSGLEVDALDGKPGVRSARFAGENASNKDNNQKLLSLLTGIPYDKRTARFWCVLALVTTDGDNYIKEGVVEGHIALEESGAGGFGYDPLFIPKGHSKTMAEFEVSNKNEVSHRGKALKKMADLLIELYE